MRPVVAVMIAIGFLFGAAPEVRAAGHPGWGDTGWVYASKRECCEAAIGIASRYSADACVELGGTPRPSFGSQRGTCKWEWMQDGDGSLLYRCYGEASVWCR
jgi:hypothetical protein